MNISVRGAVGVAGWWRLERYPAISVRSRLILSLDTCLKQNTTLITLVTALPVLMEQEAMTLDATDFLVISAIDACWPSYWAAQICHALICLQCQGKQSWSLDIWIFCPENSLLGSAECIKSCPVSGVLINCIDVYPLKLQWDCALSVSCLLGAEFSFKLLYLMGNSEFSHTLEFQKKFKSVVIHSFIKAM